MELNEIADIHNRRRDIQLVSDRCKANHYPLIVWPEDKALLRISDLPLIPGIANKPADWLTMDYCGSLMVQNDVELREQIHEGYAYALHADHTQHINHYQFVGVWKVRSR